MPARVIPMAELVTRYYIRLTVVDQPGVLARIAKLLGDAKISIASVIQKETHEASNTAELVIMTHEAREASVQDALKAVAELPEVQAIGNFIRVEEQ
jgi:homoserine dehydrogenase